MKVHAVNVNLGKSAAAWTLEPLDGVGYIGPVLDTKAQILLWAAQAGYKVVPKPKKPRKADKKFVIRLSLNLHKSLQTAAKANRRSMNAEMLFRLQDPDASATEAVVRRLVASLKESA